MFSPFSHITWETDSWHPYRYQLTRNERKWIRTYYRNLRMLGATVVSARMATKNHLDEIDAKHAQAIGI